MRSTSPLSGWNSFDNTVEADIPGRDSVTVTVKLTGVEARFIRQEAARRGVEKDEMAKIFIEQGIFFWRGKA